MSFINASAVISLCLQLAALSLRYGVQSATYAALLLFSSEEISCLKLMEEQKMEEEKKKGW
jgi:hypothetical protein